MGLILTVKRRTYSDSDEKSGMSTGKKVGLAAGLATAATAGLAFAASKGKLGPNMQSKVLGLTNKFQTAGKNLTGKTINGNGYLNSNSQRAANAGVKLDTTTNAAKQQLANGTGFNSVKPNKKLTELDYEQMMAFSETEK